VNAHDRAHETKMQVVEGKVAASKVAEANEGLRWLGAQALTVFEKVQDATAAADAAGFEVAFGMTPEIASAWRTWLEEREDPVERVPQVMR
jgi:hypothetical protein